MTLLFWLLVALDLAVLALFGLLGLAAAGPSHTNPLAALVIPFFLPALVLAGAVVLFLRSPAPPGRVAALVIAALPLLLTLGARGVAQWVAATHTSADGGMSQFTAGPARELEAAIARHDTAAVTRLLPRVDLNKPGISGATLLVLALRRLREAPTELDVLRALLKAGANPNLGKDEPPLQAAIGLSRTAGLEPLRLLLAAGADPNARDAWGEPVFFVAGGAELDPAVMQEMLDHGADIRATGRDGHTVLSLPASLRNWKLVLMLLQRGAPWRATRSVEGLPFRAWVEGQTGQGTGGGLAEVIEFLRAADEGGGPGPSRSGAVFKADSPITAILQDRAGHYWFGTDREGVYRYDGRALVRLGLKDGLCSTQVRRIQEDDAGHLWIATSGGVSRFDGRGFRTYPPPDSAAPAGAAAATWSSAPGDLWFEVGGGAYRRRGERFDYLALPGTKLAPNQAPTASGPVGPYTVYSSLKDRAGNLWFGTQSLGVCRYDGVAFTWLAGEGLAGPAVLALFQDRAGHLWFGNNGAGVFRYDGTRLVNLTREMGLGDPDFLKGSAVSGKPGPESLARIYSIAQDSTGDIWFGTIDAGLWRYDGKAMTHFSAREGLDSAAIRALYLDRRGDLLVGTDGGSVYRVAGAGLIPFTLDGIAP